MAHSCEGVRLRVRVRAKVRARLRLRLRVRARIRARVGDVVAAHSCEAKAMAYIPVESTIWLRTCNRMYRGCGHVYDREHHLAAHLGGVDSGGNAS